MKISLIPRFIRRRREAKKIDAKLDIKTPEQLVKDYNIKFSENEKKIIDFSKGGVPHDIEFDTRGLIKEKPKNEYKPPVTDPNSFTMIHMEEVVFVKLYSQSPVDMLAARIANRITKEGLCKVTKTEMAGELIKYKIVVTIAKEK
jgi:hypothetical protein